MIDYDLKRHYLTIIGLGHSSFGIQVLNYQTYYFILFAKIVFTQGKGEYSTLFHGKISFN